ncbi:flavin reductase family protein [Phenylobacterium sp.]|uniref:flavin reductase family protein n=1 Tax=Phenylobacterium sp. TaxID=1871053 RepID=UPI0012299F08|nr:flavin reductase family protein [Phenylobacterium sp.]THD60455.1 MAG: flavin reductase family protein [Phenylobacterium sp.]
MADENAHYYEPKAGHGLRHDPFNAVVGPRPIGWISSIGPDGVHNLAPYSFFNAFNYTPPLIGFASMGRKDSVANIEAAGEFCWNLATKALAEPMNLTSAPAPLEVDEFALAGLTAAPGRKVKAPRVLESPVNFECVLAQVIQLQGADGIKVDAWLVLGEVVAVHIDKALIRDGVYQTAEAHPILRAGRMGDYAEIRPDAMFEMRRPGWPIG